MIRRLLLCSVAAVLPLCSALAGDYKGLSQKRCADRAALMFGILVVSHDIKAGTMRLFVREREWSALNWDNRADTAALFNCAITPEGSTAYIDFIGDASGQVLARWDGLRLNRP